MTDEPDDVLDDDVLIEGAPARIAHVPVDAEAMHPWFRRFNLGVGIARLVIPIVTFFTIVFPLGASIGGGETRNIYLALLTCSWVVMLAGGWSWGGRGGRGRARQGRASPVRSWPRVS